jgi:hypothetical protein
MKFGYFIKKNKQNFPKFYICFSIVTRRHFNALLIQKRAVACPF